MDSELPYKVVLVDYDDDLFAPRGWEGEVLAAAGARWIAGQYRDPEAIVEVAGDADVVMIQSVRPLINRPVIEELGRCRCIVRVGIGYDSIDLDAATERGIMVCNVPEYCVEEVADHALALLLSCARHLTRLDRWMREGRWDRTGVKPARRLRGRVLGLVAFGRTARALLEKVRGMGFTLLAYDPYIPQEVADGYGVTLVGLDELLRRSDLISVHTPLTEETYHMIGARELA
ncbi:MAG: NAD(P)-dependent oxidoreductase, partial [Candidatus Bathyarchaeia archaeon]